MAQCNKYNTIQIFKELYLARGVPSYRNRPITSAAHPLKGPPLWDENENFDHPVLYNFHCFIGIFIEHLFSLPRYCSIIRPVTSVASLAEQKRFTSYTPE